MKKYRIIALLLVLCLCLAGCGGNSDQPQSETPDEPQVLTPDEPHTNPPTEAVPHNTQMLMSTAEPVIEMTEAKREHYNNGTYYYMDVAGDNALRCISSCYQTTLREGETEEEYATRRAIGLSVTLAPGNPYNLMVGKDDALSESLGYPVYLVSFLTGNDLNASCWTVFLTRTEAYSYQYAFAAEAQTSLEMEEAFMDYFRTLKLADLPEN